MCIRDSPSLVLNLSGIKSDEVKGDNVESKMSVVLPKLKNNMNNHTDKEVYVFEMRNKQLVTKFNSLISQNKSFAKSLKELRISENNQEIQLMKEMDVRSLVERQESLDTRISKVTEEFKGVKKQKKRLIKLRLVGTKNNRQHEKWIRSLTYLVENLKKMIKWEQEFFKQRTDLNAEIVKLTKTTIELSEERSKNKTELIEQLLTTLRQKKSIDGRFVTMDEEIMQGATCLLYTSPSPRDGLLSRMPSSA
eukprot:TRINITY_DN16506_c0_g1_i1.p2 TRINITY_DN16506_c0_g1~~TRINITY_DN16506_c0_g1_i1.p2  ORF type:complete len:261 (-),score=99.07 TRINITY_DN16506_c0_g1_i1:9-758(-)